MRRVRALVDTGASRTVIEEDAAESPGLWSLGEEYLHTPSTGGSPAAVNVYAIEISLAGDVTGTLADNLRVIATAGLAGLGVDMLLGRDVLGRAILT